MKVLLIILCLGLSVGGKSLAVEVAAKHLEDYLQHSKMKGEDNAVTTLRMQEQYLWLKTLQLISETSGSKGVLAGELTRNPGDVSGQEKAYQLAKSRYEQGLGTLWDMYETGLELYVAYSVVGFIENNVLPGREVVPTAKEDISFEQLNDLRRILTNAANASGNREAWLRTEILWSIHVSENIDDEITYRTELVELLRNRYLQGLATHWEVAIAELDLQKVRLLMERRRALLPGASSRLFPTSDDAQKWEVFVRDVNALYRQLAQTDEDSRHSDSRICEQLFHLRFMLLRAEYTLNNIKAVLKHGH